MADTVIAVDHCCVNVERAKRELVQPRPRPGGLPRRPLVLSFFRAKAPHVLCSSRCSLPRFLLSFFRRFGCNTPTAPRILYCRQFSLFACDLRTFLLSSLRVPLFPWWRCTNFAAAGTTAAGNYFALLGCIIPRRCCWQASTVSIDVSFQPSTSCREFNSCENSIASTSSN